MIRTAFLYCKHGLFTASMNGFNKAGGVGSAQPRAICNTNDPAQLSSTANMVMNRKRG